MSKKKNNPGPTPKTIEEAFEILDQMISEDDRKAIIDGEDVHFGLGLWIRNNWFYNSDFMALYEDMQRAELGEDGVMIGPDGNVIFIGDGDMFSSSLIELYRKHLTEVTP